MHVLAALFDVGDNGFDIYDASVVVGLIVSLYFGVRWAGRKIDERIAAIAEQLDQRTEQIQPDANHGKSLPDVHDRLERVERRIDWLADLVVAALTGQDREARLRRRAEARARATDDDTD